MIGGSLLFVCAPCERVISLAVTGCVSALPRTPARVLLCTLCNCNGEDTHSRKYLSSFARWLSRLMGFTLTVKLTAIPTKPNFLILLQRLPHKILAVEDYIVGVASFDTHSLILILPIQHDHFTGSKGIL